MICVAVRNIVRVFIWSSLMGSTSVKFAREHTLEEEIVGISWAGINLCVGFASGSYMFLDPVPGIVVQDVHVNSDGGIEGDVMDVASGSDMGGRHALRPSTDLRPLPGKVTRLPVAVLHDAELMKTVQSGRHSSGDGGTSVLGLGLLPPVRWVTWPLLLAATDDGERDFFVEDDEGGAPRNTGELMLAIRGPFQYRGLSKGRALVLVPGIAGRAERGHAPLLDSRDPGSSCRLRVRHGGTTNGHRLSCHRLF